MKVILYMAISVDGYIAKTNDDTPWSEEEWDSYSSHVAEAGNIIIGRKTYDLMKGDNTLESLKYKDLVILSRKPQQTKDTAIHFVNSIEEGIKFLTQKGYQKILIGGGEKTNTSALESGLLDEIILDIEPWLFGKGYKLSASGKIDLNLQLLNVTRIGKYGIQLHYKVAK